MPIVMTHKLNLRGLEMSNRITYYFDNYIIIDFSVTFAFLL